MNNIKSWIKWLASLAVVIGFAAGVPLLLLASPSPLDPDRGVRSIVDALVTNGQVFEEALVSVVVAVAWALWCYLVLSAVMAVVGAARGAVLNVSGFGFGQRLVVPIITALMWSSTATTLAMSVVGAGGLTMATGSLAAAQEVKITQESEETAEVPSDIEQVSGNLVLVNGELARAHVVVVDGDTMWDLAAKHLGDAFRWTEIADLNLGLAQPTTRTVTNADLIWPDTVLLMPEDAVGVIEPSGDQMATLCATRTPSTAESNGTGEASTVVVVEGDTLWDLAGEHLGDAFRWPELAEQTVGMAQENSPVVTDPDLIWPGTVVGLPPTSSTVETVTEDDCEPEANGSGVESDGVVIVPEINVWRPDSDPSALEAGVVAEGESVNSEDLGLRSAGASSTELALPWWLIAAAATAAGVFAAGMLRLLAKRRERAAAMGEGFDDELLEEFEDPARSTRDHLLAASSSLSAWVTESDVFLFQVDRDKTSAVFVGGDVRPHSTSPWQFGSTDGSLSTWELPHDEVDAGDGSYCLWGFGNGVFFNLEELGSIGVAGSDEEQMLAMLRHMLHDVLGNFGQDHDVIVRVGGAVADVDEISCYGVGASTSIEQMRAEIEHLFVEVDMVHGARGTALLAEMRDEDAPYPTLLVVLTPQEREQLEDLQERLEQNPGRYPVVMLTVGSGATGLWTVRVESDLLATVGSERLGAQRLKAEPALMDRATALRISQALGGRVDRDPLVGFDVDEPTAAVVALSAKESSCVDAMNEVGIALRDTTGDADDVDEDDAQDSEREESEGGEVRVWFHHQDGETHAGADDGAGSTSDVGAGVAEQMSDAYAAVSAVQDTADDDVLMGLSDGDEPEDLLAELAPGTDTGGSPGLENPVGPGHRDTPAAEVFEVGPGMTPAKVLELASGGEVGAWCGPAGPDVRFMGKVTVPGRDVSAAAAAGSAILAWFGPISRERWVDLLWNGKPVQSRRVRVVLVEIRKQWGPVFSDLDGSLHLRAVTDIDMAAGLITQSRKLDWPAAVMRLKQASDLCRGEIFAEAPGGRWWQWTGIEIESARQDRARRLLEELVGAAERARVQGDLAMVEQLCGAARRVNPVAMAPVEMMAQCLALAGHRDRALAVIADWEQRYEDRFDEEAPESVRAKVAIADARTG